MGEIEGSPSRTWYGGQWTSIVVDSERRVVNPIPKRPMLDTSLLLVLSHGIINPSMW